ncbi:phosphoglycerate kinase [Patescibacteria group bacterium]|nr:phosphoglycerate kinase [Patescibacteria group bacterium]MCG2695234.1 phosphoglycerate kinase [Candidatus Parcubacteria bacterium]
MKNIKDAKNLRGKRVLLRLDLNVPVEKGTVMNDFKIKKIIPTLEFLQKKKAKIIILSHVGREKTDSLKPVFNYFKKTVKMEFVEDISDKRILNVGEGEIVMLENLRKYDGETKNSIAFVKKLVSLGDIFVNEAFAVSHRKHASIVGIPKYLPSYSGILFEEEIKNLSQCFKPQHPAVFILGGNKFRTKLPLIKKNLKVYDTVFIGGALANDFFREKGFNIGSSVVSNEDFKLDSLLKNKKLILPVDVVVKKSNTTAVKYPDEVFDDEMIFDAGPETVLQLKEIIKDAKFVLFNGPLGNYQKGFNRATSDLIRIISGSKAKVIAGGGDTVANIFDLDFEDRFDFISTGGGAMVEFLTGETLSGVEALNTNIK